MQEEKSIDKTLEFVKDASAQDTAYFILLATDIKQRYNWLHIGLNEKETEQERVRAQDTLLGEFCGFRNDQWVKKTLNKCINDLNHLAVYFRQEFSKDVQENEQIFLQVTNFLTEQGITTDVSHHTELLKAYYFICKHKQSLVEAFHENDVFSEIRVLEGFLFSSKDLRDFKKFLIPNTTEL